MFERYAIFYTPTGGLAQWGAAWLGWDSARGDVPPHTEVAGLDVATMTATPRKYGLHATLKAPFRMAQNACLQDLQHAASEFALTHPKVAIGQLELRNDTGFVALRPQHDTAELQQLAAATVKAFDPFRAPLTDADIARRRKASLSVRQDAQMLNWGYPFIFEDFHFHLTLTGRLPAQEATAVIAALTPCVLPLVPAPLVIDAITVMGQDSAGMFHQIHRYTLTG